MADGRDPQTRAEWLEAAVTAAVCLRIDAARQYGFVEGGPEIDVARCEEILLRAKMQGIEPTEGEIEAQTRALLAQGGEE